jgi:hypothetical protein
MTSQFCPLTPSRLVSRIKKEEERWIRTFDPTVFDRGAESSSCAPGRGGGIFHFWGNFSFLGKFLGYFCVNVLIYCFSRREIFRINFPGGANSIVPRQILHLWYSISDGCPDGDIDWLQFI